MQQQQRQPKCVTITVRIRASVVVLDTGLVGQPNLPWRGRCTAGALIRAPSSALAPPSRAPQPQPQRKLPWHLYREFGIRQLRRAARQANVGGQAAQAAELRRILKRARTARRAANQLSGRAHEKLMRSDPSAVLPPLQLGDARHPKRHTWKQGEEPPAVLTWAHRHTMLARPATSSAGCQLLPQQLPGYAVIGFPEVHPSC